MPKIKINHIVVIFGVIILTIFLIRFLSPVNSWVCQNGQWVQLGNPIGDKPTSECAN